MHRLELKETNPKGYKRLRGVLAGMKQRCYNPNSDSYKKYGAKGITICDEWLESTDSFCDWMLANGYVPSNESKITSKTCTIDRIDPTKGYSPENCRIISHSENSSLACKDKITVNAGIIYQYDMDGHFIKETTKSEVRDTYDIRLWHIDEILDDDNPRQSCNGVRLAKYRVDKLAPIIQDIDKTRYELISQYKITGEYIRSFTSRQEVLDTLDITNQGLQEVLAGRQATSNNIRLKHGKEESIGLLEFTHILNDMELPLIAKGKEGNVILANSIKDMAEQLEVPVGHVRRVLRGDRKRVKKHTIEIAI